MRAGSDNGPPRTGFFISLFWLCSGQWQAPFKKTIFDRMSFTFAKLASGAVAESFKPLWRGEIVGILRIAQNDGL